jgi:hypothetical protein
MSTRPVPRSRWLTNGNRKPVVDVKVVGLNLQGKPNRSMLFFAKELQTTVFILQFSIGSYRWTVSKTFDELRDFNNLILTDSSLRSGRDFFTVSSTLSCQSAVLNSFFSCCCCGLGCFSTRKRW